MGTELPTFYFNSEELWNCRRRGARLPLWASKVQNVYWWTSGRLYNIVLWWFSRNDTWWVHEWMCLLLILFITLLLLSTTPSTSPSILCPLIKIFLFHPFTEDLEALVRACGATGAPNLDAFAHAGCGKALILVDIRCSSTMPELKSKWVWRDLNKWYMYIISVLRCQNAIAFLLQVVPNYVLICSNTRSVQTWVSTSCGAGLATVQYRDI